MLQATIDSILSTHRTLAQLVATRPSAASDSERPGSSLHQSGPSDREVSANERAFRRMLLPIVDRNIVAANL